MRSLICTLTLTAALLATSACSLMEKKDDKSMSGSLTRNLELIDAKDGVHYGSVEMGPIGGGKIFDADGRLIGTITPPAGGYAAYPAPIPAAAR